MTPLLSLISRKKELFSDEITRYETDLKSIISRSSFLVLGGAGSIGQEVVKEIFKRNPLKLHVVDISENNMVELVRDIRSLYGHVDGDFRTFALDIGSIEYDAFINEGGEYDYVLNLSALKHVRSEKDPYTLMRMISVNILNTEKTLVQSIEKGVKKYFCVSTDKATNPVNMMGASKRIMEMFLMRRSLEITVSTARFANIAFSDGSLLHGFNQRIQKYQPIVAPNDVRRYFLTPKESGELCLLSCIFGENRDIFFPKLNEELHLITFAEIAVRYLGQLGFKPEFCDSESQARELCLSLPALGKWPCLFSASDTTGEKDFEEFFTRNEILDMSRYPSVGIIKNGPTYDQLSLETFLLKISNLKSRKAWQKQDLVCLFGEMLPDFDYKDVGRYLDGKM